MSLIAACTAISAAKKYIEIGLPLARQGASICIRLLKSGSNEVPTEVTKLNKPLKIIDHSLSIPESFSVNQLMPFKDKLADGLSVIKGQNEMLFLSHSIDYFIKSHIGRTGLDRSISYALQHDIYAVRHHLTSNREIRFPGYLLHQCISLSETIKDINILYVSVLDNGIVPEFRKKKVREVLTQRYGPMGEKAKFASYIPYDLQLPVLRDIADENKKNKSLFEKVTGKKDEIDIDELSDKAHEALFILCEELKANEELEAKLSEKVSNSPEKKIFLESCSQE